MSILMKIIEEKRKDLKHMGYSHGVEIPGKRRVPIVSVKQNPLIICEIKRTSPSKGTIKADIDPVKQAEKYIKKGARAVSVLTEKRYFSGSLRDLMLIKNRFPNIPVLRKDFILKAEEVDISYRAGADAILLIASILSLKELYKIYRRARRYKMDVLFEVHSEEDIKKAYDIKPEIIGINSRNLEDFSIDLFNPLKLKKLINWKATTIFESGIKGCEDALFALSSGFHGLLIGEAVVKNPALIEDIVSIYKRPISNFWERLFKKDERPLVKICGITRTKDVHYLEKKGVDAMGFIFAPSPRMTNSNFLKNIGEINAVKVAVITPDSLSDKNLKKETEIIIEENLVDAVQLHGFPPSFRLSNKLLMPYYNALRVKGLNDIKNIALYNSQRVLIDAFDTHSAGGTGKSIPDEIIYESSKITPLWVAGGIGVNNIKTIIKRFKPELVDASSSLEKSPGIKDHSKLDNFFEEIKNAKATQ